MRITIFNLMMTISLHGLLLEETMDVCLILACTAKGMT